MSITRRAFIKNSAIVVTVITTCMTIASVLWFNKFNIPEWLKLQLRVKPFMINTISTFIDMALFSI